MNSRVKRGLGRTSIPAGMPGRRRALSIGMDRRVLSRRSRREVPDPQRQQDEVLTRTATSGPLSILIGCVGVEPTGSAVTRRVARYPRWSIDAMVAASPSVLPATTRRGCRVERVCCAWSRKRWCVAPNVLASDAGECEPSTARTSPRSQPSASHATTSRHGPGSSARPQDLAALYVTGTGHTPDAPGHDRCHRGQAHPPQLRHGRPGGVRRELRAGLLEHRGVPSGRTRLRHRGRPQRQRSRPGRTAGRAVRRPPARRRGAPGWVRWPSAMASSTS